MKSPLKPIRNSLAANLIGQKIGHGKIVDSFFFADGVYECRLASRNNFVIGHTNSYVVHEFWNSLKEERIRTLMEGVCADLQPVFNEQMYELLQERWHQEESLFIRSALFFFLSRCSSKGLPSSGTYTEEGFTPIALSYLKNLNTENMHFVYNNSPESPEFVKPTRPHSVMLMNLGHYGYGLTQGDPHRGVEEGLIPHKQVSEHLASIESPWIVNYQFSKPVLRLYPHAEVMLIDQYGNRTTEYSDAREVLFVNF